MRKGKFLWIFILVFFVLACEKSYEDKKKEIIENQLKNDANRAELRADSLMKQVEQMKEEAKALKKKANSLRDSARKINQ
jgi:F0F1-type ATP synthase membrane subunit b/b'